MPRKAVQGDPRLALCAGLSVRGDCQVFPGYKRQFPELNLWAWVTGIALMANSDQLALIEMVKRRFPHYFKSTNVLEVGSLDINGSIRRSFSDCSYVGVDVAPGNGVDEVCQGQDLSYPSNRFDVVVSCECMEHNPFWAETMSNMLRMTKPNGLVIMTCATTGYEEHGTTRTTAHHSPLTVGIGWEYYRNLSSNDLEDGVNLKGWFSDYIVLQNWDAISLYFVGIKRPFHDPAAMAALRSDMNFAFRKTRSIRSIAIYGAVSVLGERGVHLLRAAYRLAMPSSGRWRRSTSIAAAGQS
jgi:SAM-dependent methyltransferase